MCRPESGKLRVDRPAGPANPFEAWCFGVSILAGVLATTPYATPVSLDYATWSGFQVVWGSIHAIAATTALFGLYWPGNPITGIYVKRAGMVGLGGTLAAYSVALLTVAGAAGVVVGIELVGLSVACFVRSWQVTWIARRTIARAKDLERVVRADGEGRTTA